MDSLQKIDAVLRVLVKSHEEDLGGDNIADGRTEIGFILLRTKHSGIKLTIFEAELILQKLILDNYAFIDQGKSQANRTVYTVNYNGIIFYKNGGYKGEIDRSNENQNRLLQLEKNQIKNADNMTLLTRLLALISMGMLLLESIKQINDPKLTYIGNTIIAVLLGAISTILITVPAVKYIKKIKNRWNKTLYI